MTLDLGEAVTLRVDLVDALLRHAYAKVPYYRRRFDNAGIHPDQVRTLEDLRRVPITLKSDLRALPEEDLLARDCVPNRLLRYGTGGSTGVPTEVCFTRFEDRLLRLMRIQVLAIGQSDSAGPPRPIQTVPQTDQQPQPGGRLNAHSKRPFTFLSPHQSLLRAIRKRGCRRCL
ncbi:MAG TPA: hypothetical protein VFA33_10750 [Bryobacteraceae bacterium]|nr:hypothetical protein [Bryobacteraceae bacterium]